MRWSTFQLERAFEISRVTLQSWLDKGHIVPEKVAEGRGDRTRFSGQDTLGLLLFQLLCDAGLSQREASRIASAQTLDEKSIKGSPILVVARCREGKFFKGSETRTDSMPNEIPTIARPNGFMLVVDLSELAKHMEAKLAALAG